MRGEKRMKSDKGFTLIEIIVVLVLLGILGAGGAMMISKVIEGYVFARDNDAIAQKTQAALNRMAVDFTYIDKAVTATQSSSGTSFTYTGDYPDFAGAVATEPHTITISGTTVTYDGITLIDNVASGGLTFSYFDTYAGADTGSFGANTALVGISLTVTAADGQTKTYTSRAAVAKTGS